MLDLTGDAHRVWSRGTQTRLQQSGTVPAGSGKRGQRVTRESGGVGGGERLRATRLQMRAPSERGTPAAAHASHDPCRRAQVADSHAGQTGTAWDRLGPQQKPSGMPLRAQSPRSGGRARMEGRRGRWPSHAASDSMLARARLACTSSLIWTRLTFRRGREKRPQVRSPGLCCAVGVYIK